MAPKSVLFLLAFVLVVTRMGSSVEEFNYVAEAPVYAPTTAPTTPAYAPASPLPYGFGTACTAMCAVQCRLIRPIRACRRTCTACCAKFRCVPAFSKCGCEWDTVTIRQNTLKCP